MTCQPLPGYQPLPSFWAAASFAERSAAYDNSKAVVDSPALIAARDAEAAPFRAARAGHLDLAYGAGPRNAWDLFPAKDPAAPCLVFIHGGYWQRNARVDFAGLAAGLNDAGWAVALPGYTLAPEASLADIAAEIGASLDWLAGEGKAHGIGGPIILSGWSAGGHLAALHLGHRAVAAALAISGVYDLAPIRDTYLNEKLSLTDEEIATLSPLRLPVTDKPMTLAYGSRELPALVHDARRLHALRAAAHAPGALLPVPGADHFSILDGFSRSDGLFVRAARDLLDSARACRRA